jgi:ribosomal protein L31E
LTANGKLHEQKKSIRTTVKMRESQKKSAKARPAQQAVTELRKLLCRCVHESLGTNDDMKSDDTNLPNQKIWPKTKRDGSH